MFLLIGGNFYPCLMQKAWGELPVFEVMVWQRCDLLRPSLNCFCLLQCNTRIMAPKDGRPKKTSKNFQKLPPYFQKCANCPK